MSGLLIAIGVIAVLIFIGFIAFSIYKDKQKQLTFQTNNAINFGDAKNNYLNLSNKEYYKYKSIKELPTTKLTYSGIYAIYYANQSINEIVPVYVGQAKNIRKRWFQHVNEIKKVKLGQSTSRKYSKMLHYGSTKDLSDKDLHFAVLEKTSNLDQRELHYISAFKADIYGFNATKGNNINY